MCDTQTLASSSEGYLIRCSDCGRMQLCFGIVAAALKREQFNRLKVCIDEILHGPGYNSDPCHRPFSVPVNKSVILCLNRTEIFALEELISQAHALLEVYEMLEKGTGS